MSVLYGFAERAAELIKQDNTGTPTTRAIHPNGDTTKCLEVTGPFANGSPVTVAGCNNNPQQQWEISASSTRVKVNGQNYCLDAGSSPGNGVGMKIWTCYDNLPAQTWAFANGNIKLVSANQCIDRKDGGSGVQTWNCFAGNANQVWTV